MSDKFDEQQPIIIKKVKGGHGGHHGGAWKVAYADFVTAMMAFFLLLWLLSVTTEVQKNGISDYFTSTPMITRSEDGAGGILGGTTIALEGAMTSTVQPLVEKPMTEDPALKPGSMPIQPDQNIADKKFIEEQRLREQEQFEQTAKAIKKAIESNPQIADMVNAMRIDQTTEGLRIQMLEQQDKPLFASGSANLLPQTKKLMRQVSEIIQGLPNEISIRGHTDSVPYGPGASYTNWELSADRANSSRRALENAGMPSARINNVLGKADSDPLIEDDPRDGRNRRISIIVLHQDIAGEAGANSSARAKSRQEKNLNDASKLYERSQGKVEFP